MNINVATLIIVVAPLFAVEQPWVGKPFPGNAQQILTATKQLPTPEESDHEQKLEKLTSCVKQQIR